MNQKQAKRIVAAYVAGTLVSVEAFGGLGLSEADEGRLAQAADDLLHEMLRRSGREHMGRATIEGLVADELAR